jgi:hypothetical protein
MFPRHGNIGDGRGTLIATIVERTIEDPGLYEGPGSFFLGRVKRTCKKSSLYSQPRQTAKNIGSFSMLTGIQDLSFVACELINEGQEPEQPGRADKAFVPTDSLVVQLELGLKSNCLVPER